ncbi:MAG: Mth938-like domain-containing protein [Gammaproteobacteria bacterium]|jgi:uncharacterized protein|nr:Mth938-like domain-containing protein [Gammaproteobacteria bacterium]
MQINRDSDANSYGILSYDAGEVTVLIPRRFDPEAGSRTAGDISTPAGVMRRETLRRSLLIMPEMLIPDWAPQRWEDLDSAHFDMLIDYAPEVVLFGAGARLRHPPPRLYAGLTSHGIGVEVMDTGSACRTYNFLMTDRRKVLAALLMIDSDA